MKLFKEKLDGKYDAVIPSVDLPKGWISDGSNVRKVSSLGGWRPRKGCTFVNTTAAESGSDIDSIHQYTNPINADWHLLIQVNNDILERGNLTLGASAGTSILASGVTVGTNPGFSDVIGENLVYADGSGPPLIYGGDSPYCIGFVTYDASEDSYSDVTDMVTDGFLESVAIEGAMLGSAAGDLYYVCSPTRANSIILTFGSNVNYNTVTLAVKAWRNGSWTAVSGLSDGTAGTETHDQDGTISWTYSTSDDIRALQGIMGYWYQVSFSAAIDPVGVDECKIGRLMDTMENRWDGLYANPTGIYFYDQTDGSYTDYLSEVTDGSTATYMDLNAMTSGDYIYIKTPTPAMGFGFALVDGTGNSADAQISSFHYYCTSAWVDASTTLDDETLDSAGDSSFNKTGVLWFDVIQLSRTPSMRTLQEDAAPGYWYRIYVDATLTAGDIHIYQIVYAPYLGELGTYDGVVEFDGRAYYWGDTKYPNRLRYSTVDSPDVLQGDDSGYTGRFGDKSKVLLAIKLYENLVVFKRKGIWTYDTNGNINRIANKVGIGGVKSAQIVEVGLTGMRRDELVSLLIWQYLDGVYVLDGVKPKKISDPIAGYFDPEYAEYIPAAELTTLESFNDPIHYEYHLLTTTTELVYNYKTDEWYPPFARSIVLSCGQDIVNTSDRINTLGGSTSGFIMRLENDTTDKNTSNQDVAISHYVTTRSIAAVPDESTTLRFTPRYLWAEFKAQTAGSATVTAIYPDSSSTTSLDAMSFANSGAEMAIGKSDLSEENTTAIAFKFLNATADQQMEIWSIAYEIDAQGEIKL